MEEGGVMLLSPPLQHTVDSQGPLPLFTDWSSIGSGSPPVIPPPKSVPVGDVLMTPGIEGIQETDQTALQTSQPISQRSYMGALSGMIQENLPTTPNVCQQPLEILNVSGERRMADMGTNTSDVMIEPTGSGQRLAHMETNAQPSIPIVDVLLPSNLGDHVPMLSVNLSILGYEPD